MSKFEKVELIEGIFTHEDAKEILINIFSTKIQFHELKNFSSQERFGEDDKVAQKRIPELKRSVGNILKVLEEAKKQNKYLKITSEINISLIEHP
ncbi:hypothetical protein [Flectobacillus major]|uniref:hypothetical protein n=1 Tax=Flectobacillus major TaxID=103 RepID=UPI00040944D4|nr:hypothetical protein [Flectobacillus major]